MFLLIQKVHGDGQKSEDCVACLANKTDNSDRYKSDYIISFINDFERPMSAVLSGVNIM